MQKLTNAPIGFLLFVFIGAAVGQIDLSGISNPYSGSTNGNSDAVQVCGNTGPDQGFSVILTPNEQITIGQTSNDFDSLHSLRHGGAYPGDFEVACVDDPDEGMLLHVNDGDEDLPVYFIVDGYNGGSGNFVLAWEIRPPPHQTTPLPIGPTTASPTASLTEYTLTTPGCVNGNNLESHDGRTVEECTSLCNQLETCRGFEYGVDHGVGSSYGFAPGLCQLSGPSVNTNGCDGFNAGLDFYTKTGPH
jgi:hypothetical protein